MTPDEKDAMIPLAIAAIVWVIFGLLLLLAACGAVRPYTAIEDCTGEQELRVQHEDGPDTREVLPTVCFRRSVP